MSEEKIIKVLTELISWQEQNPEIRVYEIKAIQGLLDLYQQEKEKNKELSETNKKLYETGLEIGKQHIYTSENYICKDKIRELKKTLQEQITETRELFFDRNTISEIICENEIKLLQELLEE